MVEPVSLNALGLKFGTDKSTRHHAYTILYDRILSPLRVRESGKIIEIGIFGGASLRMWREWFPAGWEVIGVENGTLTGGKIVDVEGCLCVKANAANRETMARMAKDLGPFDIVLDDGSHLGHEQIATFEALWPHVRTGGVYVIEDLHAAYHQPGFGTLIMDFLLERLHDLNAHGHGDVADFHKDPRHDLPPEENAAAMNTYERTIERVDFHRSVVFIWRR